MRPVFLLILSNLFMTVAWYGHLKFKGYHIAIVIFVCWLIALPEYCLQVPANRLGHRQFTAPQLKIIQEAISIGIFVIFSILYLKETPGWRTAAAFVLILLAVVLAATELKKDSGESANGAEPAQRIERGGHVEG